MTEDGRNYPWIGGRAVDWIGRGSAPAEATTPSNLFCYNHNNLLNGL